MSRHLASVILKSTLDGEAKPPCSQSDLTKEELQEKEATLFDKAMEHVCDNYWKDIQFNGADVTTQFEPCLSKNQPFDDYDVVQKKY